MEKHELLAIVTRERASRKPVRILCCTAAGCLSSDGQAIKDRLEAAVKAAGAGDRVQVCGVGCLRLCSQGPLLQIDPEAILIQKARPEDAAAIVALACGRADAGKDLNRGDLNHPFFSAQLPIVLENSGRVEPERIESYIEAGGYQALHQAVRESTPAEIVDEISRSGLRGRGGAGFPAGLKWSLVAKTPSHQKYVVCNADEGDPGAFMDRSVLESDPHRILEGMAIAAFAVGASQGYIYIRGEYPLAINRLQGAIRAAKRMGVIGSRIFEAPFDFNIDIRIGAGAFVCGEETALMASIEGRRGTPNPRPPYPAEHGLWGCPTLINNVETFANIPPIIQRGAAWFASIGTEKSKGTKVFALAGKVSHTGLIEVPMGTPLHQIVNTMGGGVPGGGEVKAIQTGGPSGGCIPAKHFDTPVDYESLASLGSIMGSGGMIVMDESTNMVDVARFFMEFCMDESCGKCIPCRAGTVQMHDLLGKICRGEATQRDLELLRELCEMVKATSLCGLGQTAPNPVLSTLRFFEREYLDLLRRDGEVPAMAARSDSAQAHHEQENGNGERPFTRSVT
jgi:bidirectional [NiFe] hydrogenase diaphorase subunit